jgi:hypothetical protein
VALWARSLQQGVDSVGESPNRDIQAQELEIVTNMLRVFQDIPRESRQRVIETVSRFFDLGTWTSVRSIPSYPSPDHTDAAEDTSSGLPSFSEDRSVAAKQFMFQKQPRTDVEKVACLAYYLTHYRDTPYFKTLDISKLNTEAAQVKFSNPTVAVDNATKQHYLVQATKGNKQLSAIGEQFVHALPDRDKAREVMNHARPRRRRVKDESAS